MRKFIDGIKAPFRTLRNRQLEQRTGFDLKGSSSQYVMKIPSDQNAVDLFKGEWSSILPQKDLVSGHAALFEDPRIEWLINVAGGVEGKSILELGPLEGGHAYMMEKNGAQSITAIEANMRAYLKCLIAKEIYDLKSVNFLLGDFIEYMRASDRRFDICLASGVLYHMKNPVEMLELIANCSDTLYLWTHYCDPATTPYAEEIEFNQAGFKHKLYVHTYGSALGWDGFCGGSGKYSCWLSKDEIMAALQHFGFRRIETAFDQPDHPNGPSISITAFK